LKSKDPAAKENTSQYHKTPIEFAIAALELVFSEYGTADMYRPEARYLDPGSGEGVWGRACRQVLDKYGLKGDIYGVEMENRPVDPVYKDVRQADFLGEAKLFGDGFFTAAFGNPPFFPSHYFVMEAWKYCKHGAPIAMLLPINFLNGQWRHQVFYPSFAPTDIYPISERISYSGDGKTDAREYGLFIFKVGYIPSYSRTHYGWRWEEGDVKIRAPRKTKAATKSKKAKAEGVLQPSLEGMGYGDEENGPNQQLDPGRTRPVTSD
jgi:hypothetical protein